MSFSQVNFHIYDNICRDLCSVGHAKTSNCFPKICKAKIEFFTNIRMTNSEKKNKSYDKTAVWNDPGNNTKKLKLDSAMPKAIIEVYFEPLVTNFYAQISCSCHSKFMKIISILMHRIAITVFSLHKFSRVNLNVLFSYMSHELWTKIMAQLNFVQRLQISNQKYSNFDTRRARHEFYQNNIWRLCACVVQMFCK